MLWQKEKEHLHNSMNEMNKSVGTTKFIHYTIDKIYFIHNEMYTLYHLNT